MFVFSVRVRSASVEASPQRYDAPCWSVHSCFISGASMPCSLILMPLRWRVSPSTMRGVPERSAAWAGKAMATRMRMSLIKSSDLLFAKLFYSTQGCLPKLFKIDRGPLFFNYCA